MRTKNLFSCLMVGLILIGGIGCEYDDYPDPIWNPDETGGATPVITSMDPTNVAYDGLTVVTIDGENFSPVLTQNQVTFNGVVATIDTNLSTAAQLIVTMPIIITDAALNAVSGVQVMVAVQGAYAGAVYDQDFRVERAVIEWGGFIGEKPEKLPNAVAVDADENVYVAAGGSDKVLYKIDPMGVRAAFGSGLSTNTRDIKVGPGGGVFYTKNFPFIYRIPPEGGTGIASPRIKSKIACFDFNENQNIYCGGKNDSLYLYNPTTEISRGVALSEDYIYTTLRVYDGYVYVGGVYNGSDATVTVTEALWRHQILTNEDLGPKELVYDWSSYAVEHEQNIVSMTVDADGLFYIGTSEGVGPAVLILDADAQTLTPFYDAVLTSPATHLTWGNNNYIYVVRTMTSSTEDLPTGVFRIAQSGTSAPYYGRN